MFVRCFVKRAIHILLFVFLTVTIANGGQSSDAVSLNSPSGGSIVSGAALTPITEPPGAYVLPSSVCGAADGSAGLQAALNAAAGGSPWIPDGCVVNTLAVSWIPSNTTIACGTGGTIHNTAPLACWNMPSSLVSHGSSNITIEGCTFTGIYTPSMAAQGEALCPGGITGGGAPANIYGGSNIIFTDNAVTNDFSGQGLFFGRNSNVTVSNNYFANNFLMGMQVSDCKNCNFTGNTSIDSQWDIEDDTNLPAGYDIETWSNNVFSCDSTGNGFLTQDANWRTFLGGTCAWTAGAGCSVNGCTPGEYSNVTVQNNTITGPDSVLFTIPSYGAINVNNNSFTNGGAWITR
jgi:parallel beta-helix repeat protein